MSLPAAAREALAAALPDGGLREHEPLLLEGARLLATLRPASPEQAGAALLALGEAGLGALVRGGGSRLEAANAPCRAGVLLETAGLAAAPEPHPDEGVLHASAGSALSEVEASLAGSGWELPLDPPGADATVGGALASGFPGVRFGAPRAAVLGLELALPSGECVRCGGRVVKNVTGYDLAKLFVGSHGTLGLVTGAWLRLRPLPGHRLELCARAPEEPAAALGAARRAAVRIAFEREGAAGRELLLELAGDPEAVEEDAAALVEAIGAAPASVDVAAEVARVRQQGELRLRLPARATRLRDVARELEDAGATPAIDWRQGLVFGRMARAPRDERAAGALLGAAARAARRGGAGPWLVEAAPIDWRRGREVFGGVEETAPLQRALKLRFDPRGVLNPGRFAGGS